MVQSSRPGGVQDQLAVPGSLPPVLDERRISTDRYDVSKY